MSSSPSLTSLASSNNNEPSHELVDLEAQVDDDVNDNIISVTKTKSNTSLGKKLADTYDQRLSKSKVRIILLAMSMSLMLSYVDLNGLSIVLPFIANDLNAQLTISWANTSQLIAMSIFQLLIGRFADIFGRKHLLVGSIILLGFFQLACGLAQTDVQFFIFRAFCGIADGNIASLAMVIMSDIVPLKERGTYQGYLSTFIGIGNGVGPFLASAFVQHSTWRKYFFTTFSLSISSCTIIAWLVPNSTNDIKLRKKLLNIDYFGFLFGGIGLTLFLIPINGGGLQFEWKSAKVIVMFIIGGLSILAFILVEVKLAKLPMIPMKVFTNSTSICLIFLQSFLYGMAYFSLFFYYGYYFEVVRELSPILTACFLLCIVVPHSTISIISGKFVSWSGHYNLTLRIGFTLWTLALSLLASGIVDENFTLVGLAFIMVCNGLGQGMTFQNTLVAALAHSRQQDRAVIISTRQVLRFLGGSFGLAMSSLIFATSFSKHLEQNKFFNLSDNYKLKIYLKQHVYSKIHLKGSDWSLEQIKNIKALYMNSLQKVWIFWAPLIGVCLLMTFMIKDNGLVSKEDHNDKEEKHIDDKRHHKDDGTE